jgi:NOL1/NOP2/sun family putative RNA methylase
MAPPPLSGYLQERYRSLFREEEIRGFAAPLLPTLRVNTLRTTPEALLSRLGRRGVRLERVPWTESGYTVRESPVPLGATPEYLLGHYFLQDAASIYASEVLDPKEYETVLDMAAAPGGKTTHMAQRMGNRGTVVALEVNRERMRSLRSNTHRMGVESVLGIRMDALRVEELGLLFDRILLDAPCTGTGTLPRHPEAGQKGREDVERCTGLQRRLLEAATSVLKSRGRLLYSTCSLLPEENELIVEGALEDLPLRLEKIRHGEAAFTECYGRELRPEMRRAKRFYPYLHGTQGFFLALMKKR